MGNINIRVYCWFRAKDPIYILIPKECRKTSNNADTKQKDEEYGQHRPPQSNYVLFSWQQHASVHEFNISLRVPKL